MTGRADLIVTGGPVHTLDAGAPVADAVAMRDGRIVAIGSDDVRAWTGVGTHIVDTHGLPVFPGFQDAHIHPLGGGLDRIHCDLTGVHDLDAYRELVRAYAGTHPDLEWLQGAGWYGDVFPTGFPDRGILDDIEPHRPVVLTSHDGHGVWVNSAALHRAGITARTPDPSGGRIHRDGDGEPTGMLMESAANLVTDLVPAATAVDIDDALLNTQAYLHGLGITGWQDAAVGEAIGIPDSFDAYRRLAAAGRLTAKVTGALWWDRLADEDDQYRFLHDRRAAAPGIAGRFQATAVKIMQDGVCENLTGALLEPYRGRGDERGMSFIEPTALQRIAAHLAADGFDLHIHAVGDRAVREAVDAIAAAPDAPDARHQIAHIDLIADIDAARMARRRIIANVQPLWARRDPVMVDTKLPYLDDDQQRRHFAFRTLRDAGVPLALSSDWPVSSPDPLWGMHVAVNRTAPPDDPHAQDRHSQTAPLLPEQAITADEALAGYTRDAARANRLDAVSGTLRVGKDADLVVLDADPRLVPPREIGSIRARLTVAAGVIVYDGR